jgi:hypothetical protein
MSVPTHKVDNYKAGVAIEVEWNNKTEFYDRDSNRVFALAAKAIERPVLRHR